MSKEKIVWNVISNRWVGRNKGGIQLCIKQYKCKKQLVSIIDYGALRRRMSLRNCQFSALRFSVTPCKRVRSPVAPWWLFRVHMGHSRSEERNCWVKEKRSGSIRLSVSLEKARVRGKKNCENDEVDIVRIENLTIFIVEMCSQFYWCSPFYLWVC